MCKELIKATAEEKKVILFRFWDNIVPAVSRVLKWESGKRFKEDVLIWVDGGGAKQYTG
jgi:hypothetical protein